MTSPRRIIAAAATTMALGAGALLAAPAATAVPGDLETNRAVVEAWYLDFLSRDAGIDPGSEYWVDGLTQGTSEGDALWRIVHSEEYDAGSIQLYYQFLLGRTPDPGARYWVDGINAQRFPSEWAFQNVLASPEYFRGKSTAMVINGWYDVMLERGPSDGERAYWAGRIDAVGALGAVREVYYASEAVTYRITGSYYRLLDRFPSAGEVSYWSPKEVENGVNVEVLIASTPEYRALAVERRADDQD